MANTTPKTYSYAIAKNVLSDTEKNRCLCLFLSMDHSGINWAKATEDFECKSVESMRVMTRATLKKITNAEKNGGELPTLAGKAKGSAGGKKRKAAATGDDDDEIPVKKGNGGGKKKKADSPIDAYDDKEGGKKGVKNEAGEDVEDEF